MTILSHAFILCGSIFVLLAGAGLVKMPHFFQRMQASSKASTLGTIFILIGSCLAHQSFESAIKSLGIVLFLLLTTPVATHALGKSALDLKVDDTSIKN
ncbi:monovalent cation/H(+) antiporter subunit G [Pseudobacteriovorax antillogorgiicola]|uniref:Multisubunit sodium/proton antiporter, MrpG subunit n=1 Tax=Pseudobacteriovorax antillogorgiicola TaxID=1513793 RepID=A0A1Y6CP39_9BACT|nr:monovalent cation/H(+) antiporter subunit G [Pseudobacteriovorax antillogorgiicola]TCS43503.1 multisubunit sodium/proton antiporter MrpG subunit [Pseudobacteriovorax antillogorgiicola]SMF81130.1 multisubunit sodium/proton antiporter, MrpG subunit [Pseudobacteriovorax antillogorgiicola]